MTKKRLRQLFDVWKHRLGLDLWYIEVRVEACESSTSLFEAHRSVQYNRAVIMIQPWVLTGETPEDVLPMKLTDERLEEAVVHELLHCVQSRTQAFVLDRTDGQLHRDVYTMFSEGYRDVEELEIENLAVALVRAWPK